MVDFVKAPVTEPFMRRLRAQAPRLYEIWGFYPGEDGQLLAAAAGAYLAIADYLGAVALNDAIGDGMAALFNGD